MKKILLSILIGLSAVAGAFGQGKKLNSSISNPILIFAIKQRFF